MSNKEFFRQAPFFRLIFPLIIGIALRINFSIPVVFVFSLLLITFLIAFCFTIFQKLSINYKYRWVSGTSIHLVIFCLGILVTDKKIESFKNTLNESVSPVELVGIVCEPPEAKAKSVQCFVVVDQVKGEHKFTSCNDKILIYLQKDSNSLVLKAGDAIIMKCQLSKIKSTGNPYEFDYRKYLAYQGVHFSGYVNDHSWKLLANNKLPAYQMLAYNIRAKLLSIFATIGLKGDELGVASALIIGDKANLDTEIKQAYVASGTMHILAVSGMHVALLYWVLNMLLSFLNRIKHGRFLKLILLLSAVWLYALITGLGGSILRAAVMISFVIIGQSFNRNVSIFNSLAVSAFLLLIINPFNLIDVGFQLSYFAVISIVIFYPLIYELVDIKNWLGDQLWSLTAVTLAAQVLTTPISLYYFHQFPNLFIISNLIMIPLSTLIMYFAMILIPFSGWDWLAGLMGKVFNFLVWLLNKVVLTIESLPYALTKGIFITWLDVCLLYMLVCFITLYLIKRRVTYFILGLSAVAMLLIHSAVAQYQNSKSNEMVVFNDGKNTVIQFHMGNKSVWMVGEQNSRVTRYIDVARYASKCKENQIYYLDTIQQQLIEKGIRLDNNLWLKGNYIQFFNKRIIIINGNEVNHVRTLPIKADYLVVREINKNMSKGLLDCYSAKLVVINPTVAGFKAKRIEKIFSDKRVTTYNVDNSGALRIKVNNE